MLLEIVFQDIQIAFMFVFFIAIAWLLAEFKGMKDEIRERLGINNETLKLRLQAYERVALLLERITPVNIIQRVSRPGLTAEELKHLLVNDIQSEFNHNLSQQIYVSHQVWSLTRAVKEQIIQLINIAYMKMPENAKGLDLSKAIFTILIEREENPTQKALDFLNKEVHLIFTDEN